MNQYHQVQTAADDRLQELRARLLSQTTGVIRRRRYYRRAAMVAACVGCYLAGLLTVTLMADGVASETVRDVIVHKTVAPDAVATDVVVREDIAVEGTLGMQPDRVVKDEAADQPQTELPVQRRPSPAMVHKPREKKSRFLSLRDLGDQYLLEKADPAGAARCYQMALRYATREEVDEQTDAGTWLFRALKLDHQWETDDARTQG